jgi:hypothetical protein
MGRPTGAMALIRPEPVIVIRWNVVNGTAVPLHGYSAIKKARLPAAAVRYPPHPRLAAEMDVEAVTAPPFVRRTWNCRTFGPDGG